MSRRGVALLLLWLLALPAQAAVEAGRNPAKECALCHLNWIDEFARAAPQELLLPPGGEKVVATEAMCFSCHDGSVGDSRYRVWHTTMHKSGTIPSDKVRVPKEFPLDAQGGIQCATCHSAHGVDTAQDMASTIFLREPNVNSSLCQRCHQGRGQGVDEGHHPLGVKLEQPPRELLAAGGKLGGAGEVICESCHTPHGSTSERMLVIDNDVRSSARAALCESCHGVRPRLDVAPGQRRHAHPVDVPLPEGVQLPERWSNGTEPRLGSGRNIVCVTCHAPHRGEAGRHLLVDGRARDAFCLTCHAAQETVVGTAHDLARWFPDEKNASGVAARDSGTCGACHNMHDGAGPRMWARNVDQSSVDALCLGCHNDSGLARQHTTGQHSHPVGVTPTEPVPEAWPLFAADGRKSAQGRVGCASCHDVHRWQPGSDERGGKAVEGTRHNSFLRQPLGPDNGLCLGCHDSKRSVAGSKHDLALMAPASRNAAGEAVAGSGVCGACHAVHNAQAENLWNRELGTGTDVIEQSCTVCHRRGGLADGKLTGNISHPHGGAGSVRPADGLPLFTPAGERSAQGGVSCATCHDVHRWQAGVAKAPGSRKVAGTRHDSFLRLPYDDEARLCAACHGEQARVRDTAHDLGRAAPQEKNLDGATVAAGGICSACHVVHNAWGETLWARPQGVGATLNERQCRSCHADGKLAAEHAVSGRNHPLDVALPPAMTRQRPNPLAQAAPPAELPLFNAQGQRSPGGTVVCSTCHNPHVWSAAGAAAEAAGKGDGDSSFLRVANAGNSALCLRCHAGQGAVLGTKHDLGLNGAGTVNDAGQSPGRFGVCSACHRPHAGAAAGYLLWAGPREGGERAYPEQVCLGCHRAGAVAGSKVVEQFYHPADAMTVQPPDAQSEAIPLYDARGNRARFGGIACPTCHDPHQWRPGVPLRGDGLPHEGNSRDSFLRMKSSGTVCRNCHGLEALERFKLFHTSTRYKSSPRHKSDTPMISK